LTGLAIEQREMIGSIRKETKGGKNGSARAGPVSCLAGKEVGERRFIRPGLLDGVDSKTESACVTLETTPKERWENRIGEKDERKEKRIGCIKKDKRLSQKSSGNSQ